MAGRIDIAMFVSQPGVGRIHEEVWFDQIRPDGTVPNAVRAAIGNQYLSRDASGFYGTVDAVRLWTEPLSSVDAWLLFEGESAGEACGY